MAEKPNVVTKKIVYSKVTLVVFL